MSALGHRLLGWRVATVLDNTEDPSVVHPEIKVGNPFLEHPDHVGSYRKVVADLGEVVWDADTSRTLLLDWRLSG